MMGINRRLLLCAFLLMATSIYGSSLEQQRVLAVQDVTGVSPSSDSVSISVDSDDDDSDDDGIVSASKGSSMSSDDDDSDDDDAVSASKDSGMSSTKGKGGSAKGPTIYSAKGKGKGGSTKGPTMYSAKGKGKGGSTKGPTMYSAKGKGKGGSTKGPTMYSAKGKGKGGSTKGPTMYSAKGKGKGKGGLSESSKAGKGKGGKGKASKKSSKRSSKKGSKTSKKSKSPKAPTPSDPDFITAAPTSEDSFGVRPAPYALFYTLPEGSADPSEDDFSQLAEVTRLFLETYMDEKYAQTSIIILDDFLTFMFRDEPQSRPVEAVYRSVGRFNPNSIFYPPRSEVMNEIQMAFDDPDSNLMYLQLLGLLPESNVFSTVTKIEYGVPAISQAAGRAKAYISAGVGAAAAGIVILAAGIVLLRRQSKEDDDANSVDKLYAGNLKGALSLGEGTERMSDGFSEDGLEDEPLD